MPDEDNNFDGSLVLDYRKSRRHVRPKNRHCYSDFSTIYAKGLRPGLNVPNQILILVDSNEYVRLI